MLCSISVPMASVEALQKCLRDKLETMSGFGDEKKQIAILKKFFAEFDTDGSGALDTAEFQCEPSRLFTLNHRTPP